MPPLSVVFMGTAELACASLKALLDAPDVTVPAVVTQPDRPKGRDLKLQPSPVKQMAQAHSRPVLQPEKARAETFITELRALRPDLIVVVAYGQILPQALLDIPRLGALNVHTSLLPRYRGAAPIQWALLNDDPLTGVTLMKMDAGLDTGGIIATVETPIHSDDNAQTLHDRLASLGAGLLVRTLPAYAAGTAPPVPQPAGEAFYARKLTKEDGRLDWRQPARTLWNRVRAFVPWPGAYTFWPASPKPRFLKIWRAQVDAQGQGSPGSVLQASRDGIVIACGDGALRLLEVQPEGGRRMTPGEFLAGHPPPPGLVL